MKQSKSYLLKYVKSAKAETDVPTDLHDLISQRRRWLNGSFFVALHATLNWMRIFQSKHTKWRKAILLAEFVYNAWNLLFAWFNIGNFYLSFYVSLESITHFQDGLKTFLHFSPSSSLTSPTAHPQKESILSTLQDPSSSTF
jgi:chitin synthase